MRITNLREVPEGTPLICDLCIVGSGPAGLTIANELANTRHDLIVLESGSRTHEDDFAASLNEIESVGHPRVLDQRKVRNRIVGGTSHTWSGRCTAFDAIDYESRAWVPCSGWPIDAEEMKPFLRRSASYLGLVPMDYDSASLEDAGLPPNACKGLRSVVWQFSRRSSVNTDYVRFGSRFARQSADNIRVLTNATVTNIATNKNGNHVCALEISTPNRKLHHVRSRYVILCGGGIENARMLLASNRIEPGGVGNRNGMVGRFLMDHPRTVIGTFPADSTAAIQKHFGLFRQPSGARLQYGFSLSEEAQRRHDLLNCAAWTTQHFQDDDAWRALRALGRSHERGRLALAGVVLRHGDQLVSGVWNKVVRGLPLPRRIKQLDLDIMVEQKPDADSRLTLSDRKDALGVPLSRIDWKIGEMESRTAIYSHMR